MSDTTVPPIMTNSPQDREVDRMVARLVGLQAEHQAEQRYRHSRPCRCTRAFPLADRCGGDAWLRCLWCGRDIAMTPSRVVRHPVLSGPELSEGSPEEVIA